MTFVDEDKKYVLNEFLRCISHIGDPEYQIRVWIQGKGPECDDFFETVCYFCDIGELILKKYNAYGITETQYQILKNFYKEFDAFADENDFPERFIDSPEWKRIMEMAKDVLKVFNYQSREK